MKVYAVKQMMMDGYVVKALCSTEDKALLLLYNLVFASDAWLRETEDGKGYYDRHTGHVEFEIEEMEVL